MAAQFTSFYFDGSDGNYSELIDGHRFVCTLGKPNPRKFMPAT
jgi:hypothetical protein